GRPFEDAIVDRLATEGEGREGALPLLEFALTRIWEGFGEGRDAAETLRAVGGVGGALAARAQGIFERLGGREQGGARRAFVGMVQLGEGAHDTRRRVRVTALVARGEDEKRVRAVVERFADKGARLLTRSAAIADPGALAKTTSAAAAGGDATAETVE